MVPNRQLGLFKWLDLALLVHQSYVLVFECVRFALCLWQVLHSRQFSWRSHVCCLNCLAVWAMTMMSCWKQFLYSLYPLNAHLNFRIFQWNSPFSGETWNTDRWGPAAVFTKFIMVDIFILSFCVNRRVRLVVFDGIECGRWCFGEVIFPCMVWCLIWNIFSLVSSKL